MSDGHEHGDRIKSAREILEERLSQVGGRDEGAAEALRKAADQAPEGAGPS